MPGSGDSVQALKAGIMEIPDVIAINKLDHPLAKTMLSDVRQMLVPRAAGAPPPIVLTEAVRGEGVDGCGRRSPSTAGLESDGRARGASRRQPRARGVPVASARARRHLENAVADDPALRRLLDEVQQRELDPLTAVNEILEQVFHIDDDMTDPTLADIEAARERIGDHAPRDAGLRLRRSAARTGRQVWLKAENLQRTGSFKMRGALNKLATLGAAERAAGVVAASAGNHGQAVAWAARELGVKATIFMPQDAPMAKVEPTLSYGGEAVLGGAGFDEALAQAFEHVAETGATFVHAFEDEQVIAGQGTLGLELAEQVPDVDTVPDPGRRRRTRRRYRHRPARAPPEDPDRRRPGGPPRSTRSPTGSRSSTRAS